MPDHFFDELDRDEIDLFGAPPDDPIAIALQTWLGYFPSPLQLDVARAKVRELRGLATMLGFTITTSRLMEGPRLVLRTALRDARGRFVARGGQRIRQFLEESGF